ncbi:replication-relaxation family protein [Amycolatopsis sp. cmx-8-4]|uniref:replication-relaxation family protein n=1 Tax=Amycolatopsis sp. cmx-8-4 TaxID=2790947 RepID=UPI0039783DF7
MSARARAGRLAERLSQRDVAILRSLRDFRLMSGAQLRRLHFPGESLATQARKVRAALARLTDWHLVVRLSRRVGGLRAGSEGHIYGLSGLGHAVLDLDTAAPRRHRGVDPTKLAFQSHVLAIGELVVQLREHERAGLCQIEELRAEPGCWRWFGGSAGQQRVLKPDAYARLGVGEYELASFIEVDQATESLPTITRKCRVYLDYFRTGVEQQARGMFPLVWWLVPTTARLQGIAHCIGRLPAEARALFSVCLTSEAIQSLTQIPAEGGAS